MPTFRIRPLLGLKNDVPADDLTLFRYISENEAITHDTNGLNVNYKRNKNAVTKSFGDAVWSNSAVGTPTRTHGLFELDDGVNLDNILFDTGRVFYYDGSKDPQQLNNVYLDYDNLAGGSFAVGDTITGQTGGTQATVVHVVESGTTGTLYLKDLTGGDGGFDDDEQIKNNGVTADCDGTEQNTTWGNADGLFYSAIKYGSYLVFADGDGGHTPQKWANGDTNLTSLITKSGATLYKFKYLIEWQRRIIGAYSNQTNGDLEFRWTGALPTWTDLEFASANQLYKPTTDPITGISKLGSSLLYLLGEDSISRIVYYPADSTAPFGIFTTIEGQGFVNHHGTVNAQGALWGFNKNMGFIRYNGGNKLLTQDIISKDIESDIAGIDSRYYDRIIGKYIPFTGQIVWAVPLSAATTPSHLLYYDIETRQWSKENKACKFIDMWTRTAGEYQQPVFANTDGKVYQISGEAASSGNLDGYRIEPIISFGDPKLFKNITRVWFGIIVGGDYTLDLYHRGGDTVKEVLAASWTSMGTLNLNSPSEPWIDMDQNARLHQFKWGTDVDSQAFAIHWLDIDYTIGSQY